eukprot:RCo045295
MERRADALRFSTGSVGALLNYELPPEEELRAPMSLAVRSLDLPLMASKGFSTLRRPEPDFSICTRLNKSRLPAKARAKVPFGIYGQFGKTTSEYQARFTRITSPHDKDVVSGYRHIYDNTTLKEFDVSELRQRKLSPLGAATSLPALRPQENDVPFNAARTPPAYEEVPGLSMQELSLGQPTRPPQQHMSRRLKKTIQGVFARQAMCMPPAPENAREKGGKRPTAPPPQVPSMEEVMAVGRRLRDWGEDRRLDCIEREVALFLRSS